MCEESKCPKCGSTEIGQGKFSGYAKMGPMKFWKGDYSSVIAQVCTECGHIISMRVKKPQNFKE